MADDLQHAIGEHSRIEPARTIDVEHRVPVKGATLVGPLPPEIQNFTVYSAGLGMAARDHAAAVGLIKFLSGPHALPIIKAKGMEPAS
jgi:molybdate transport system substrate-binding protein